MSKDHKENLTAIIILSPMLALGLTLIALPKYNLDAAGATCTTTLLTLFLTGTLTILLQIAHRNQPIHSA